MRFVFVDEAGTSETEPITVVAALIVHADKQLLMAEAAIEEVLRAVPEKFRTDDFVFHATAIWSDPKFRDGWGMTARLDLLKDMMSVPRRLKIGAAWAFTRRDPVFESLPGLSYAQTQHVMTFGECLAKADYYIRQRAEFSEVATVVAEDVPELRRHLRLLPSLYRDNPRVRTPEQLIPTPSEQRQGYTKQVAQVHISRIRRAIHFVEKWDDPMLQLADAYAFGLRRYFSQQTFGDEFAKAIWGKPPSLEEFPAQCSSATISYPD